MDKKNLLKLLNDTKENDTSSSEGTRTLLIDGLNLFFRNFAMMNMVNPDGIHIGGLGGFFRSLGAMIRQTQPDKVYVVFDGAASTTSRKNLLPEYKSGRNEQRVTNWEVFDSLADEHDSKVDQIVRVIQYLKTLPVKTLILDKVEADDIIATIIKRTCKKWFNEKYLIISGDKDFQQLQKYPNVFQYSPIQKKFIETDSPQEYIYEHILRGDTSDGIPNFLSPDDTFVNRIKQKPVAKKKLAGWIDSLMRGNDPQDFCNEYHYRNYQRNQRLIDFDYIPDDIETDIYKEYKKVAVSNRSKILPYMIKNDLKELIGKIEEF